MQLPQAVAPRIALETLGFSGFLHPMDGAQKWQKLGAR
jgi:hypothetical protein